MGAIFKNRTVGYKAFDTEKYEILLKEILNYVIDLVQI